MLKTRASACLNVRQLRLASVALLGVVPAGYALAQIAPLKETVGDPVRASPTHKTASAKVEDIVVTAQRRAERLQNVPIAVTVLGSGTLARAGIQNVAELPELVPGLQFNTELGGLGEPRIRGVGVAAVGPGIENPVATYIDGVYYGAAAGNLFDLQDIAQVAVLKGPQGTLFGRNATGGLIQVTTKEPSQKFDADLEGTVGSKETLGANLYVTGGLTERLSGSIAYLIDDQFQGFGKNIPTDTPVQTHQGFATRGKLRYELDPDTRFTLEADYSDRRSTDFALHDLGLEEIVGRPSPGGPRDTDTNVTPLDVTRQYGVSLNAQHDFEGVRLVSITAYRDTEFTSELDGDQGPLPLVTVYDHNPASQVSQEVQLLSIGNTRLKWQAGFFYFSATGQFDPFVTVFSFPGSAPGHTVLEDTEKLNSYAGYGQATYRVLPDTNFTAGLRYTVDQRSHENSDVFGNAFFTAPPTGGSASKDFYKLTWRFALDHHFSQDVLGYVSYNRGFKSGTFDAQAIPVVLLKPETLDAYEIGLKSTLFDSRVRLNAAGYYYSYTNVQVTQFSNNTEIVYNGQGATSYGFDLDVTGNVTSDWSIDGGLGYIHGRYGNFPNAFKTVPNPACFGFRCGGNAVSLTGNATGNKLQNTPDYTFNIGTTYNIPAPFGQFTLAGNYYFSDGYFSEPENRLRQPSYSVLDASVTWLSLNGRYHVRLWGKNLTDAVYAAQLTAVDSGDTRVAAPGRIFGVTAGVHF